jgi:hypothetical protein
MTSLTNRHIDTVTRELNAAVDQLIHAWRIHNPYPTWEEDSEWRAKNPSPRERHQLLEQEVRNAVKAKTNDLIVRIQLGNVLVSDIYTALKLVLDELNEQRLSYLNTPNHD